ncbi:MAG TPA: hypothetical protein VGI34_01765 [Candidatus Acidoferrales bacterium]|jgi:hypothetical protein
MPAGSTTKLNSSGKKNPSNSPESINPDICELNRMSVRGLVPMFISEKQVFCFRLVRTNQGMVSEGISPRYTIMTLLGLRELERTGAKTPFDTNSIYASFSKDMSWIHGAGDLGLSIWLTAVFAPEQLDDLFRRCNLSTALDRYVDAREARTMEMAWFLTGLSHAALATPELQSRLTPLADRALQMLEKNQGKSGYFGHLSTTKSMPGFLRGRIGSFADQVYPIYAMSKFAVAFHREEPAKLALKCANAICQAQGELGQWWWLYDSKAGRISSKYHVYSVHQQGMAPMALIAAEEATGQSFQEPIYKGLRWIYGANELGEDMRDLSTNLVWRCIYPEQKYGKYMNVVRSLLGMPNAEFSAANLKILYEDRPYELGWLLYAFGRFGVDGN